MHYLHAKYDGHRKFGVISAQLRQAPDLIILECQAIGATHPFVVCNQISYALFGSREKCSYHSNGNIAVEVGVFFYRECKNMTDENSSN